MRLMVSNDDGLWSAGLAALVRVCRKLGHDVVICAPDSQRSAAGHSMTLNRPLRVRESILEGYPAYAISGTPADCVKLGMHCFCPDCDAVISGVNHGYNMGIDVNYSGTVAAAMEGAILGKPGIAISLAYSREDTYELAAEMGMSLLPELLRHPLAPRCILNVNYPACDRALGLVAVPLRPTEYLEDYIEEDMDGEARIFRLEGELDESGAAGDDDYSWLMRGYATVTALQADMTDYKGTELFRKILG